MSKLLPLILVVIAALEGAVVGPYWYWKKADLLISRVAVHRQEAKAAQTQREKGWDFWTVEIGNLDAELKGERTQLKQQADQLDQRAARLAAERQELDKTRADIELMRQQMDQRVVSIGADEAKNLRTLAQTYTSLSPTAAMAILREMDDATTVKILSLMKPDVVGAIFGAMAATGDETLAKRAAALSEKIRLMKSSKASSTAAN